MSFRPDPRPPIQDMPPPGGFPSVRLFEIDVKLDRFVASYPDPVAWHAE
jgi:hypothetical protein